MKLPTDIYTKKLAIVLMAYSNYDIIKKTFDCIRANLKSLSSELQGDKFYELFVISDNPTQQFTAKLENILKQAQQTGAFHFHYQRFGITLGIPKSKSTIFDKHKDKFGYWLFIDRDSTFESNLFQELFDKWIELYDKKSRKQSSLIVENQTLGITFGDRDSFINYQFICKKPDRVIENVPQLNEIVGITKLPEEKKPLVSVLMATYNRREVIGRALLSLKNQSMQDFEVIVINDGGEGVEDKLKESGLNYKYIALFENMGVINALNEGLAAAHGKYFIRLDDDDEFKKDGLQDMLSGFINDKIFSVYANVERIWYNGFKQESFPGADILLKKEDMFIQNWACTCATMHDRIKFIEVGKFNLNWKYTEDWESILKMAYRYGLQSWNYVDSVVARVNVREDSRSHVHEKEMVDEKKRLVGYYSSLRYSFDLTRKSVNIGKSMGTMITPKELPVAIMMIANASYEVTKKSIESIKENTEYPFKLLVIGDPEEERVCELLKELEEKRLIDKLIFGEKRISGATGTQGALNDGLKFIRENWLQDVGYIAIQDGNLEFRNSFWLRSCVEAIEKYSNITKYKIGAVSMYAENETECKIIETIDIEGYSVNIKEAIGGSQYLCKKENYDDLVHDYHMGNITKAMSVFTFNWIEKRI